MTKDTVILQPLYETVCVYGGTLMGDTRKGICDTKALHQTPSEPSGSRDNNTSSPIKWPSKQHAHVTQSQPEKSSLNLLLVH